MSWLRNWIDHWNGLVKKATIFDVKLAQVWSAAFVLILVKIFPQIAQISVWWFIATMALCAPRFCYLIWGKKTG